MCPMMMIHHQLLSKMSLYADFSAWGETATI